MGALAAMVEMHNYLQISQALVLNSGKALAVESPEADEGLGRSAVSFSHVPF